MDLVHGGALGPHRADLLMAPIEDWLADRTGYRPADAELFELALTHASIGEGNYERLEFLGDRVLGLAIAHWLYELFPEEPEGKLSRRLNALVARPVCAAVARDIGVADQMRLGKQAREDGASDSDNVLGDVVEALIGAIYLEAGFAKAAAVVQRLWVSHLGEQERAPMHPKSALQEWAAAHDRKPPVYELIGRSGPHHAPTFVVEVAIKGAGSARGEGLSKQEAETEAAAALLGQVK